VREVGGLVGGTCGNVGNTGSGASVAYKSASSAGGVSEQQVCKNVLLVNDRLGRIGLLAPLSADGLISQP